MFPIRQSKRLLSTFRYSGRRPNDNDDFDKFYWFIAGYVTGYFTFSKKH